MNIFAHCRHQLINSVNLDTPRDACSSIRRPSRARACPALELAARLVLRAGTRTEKKNVNIKRLDAKYTRYSVIWTVGAPFAGVRRLFYIIIYRRRQRRCLKTDDRAINGLALCALRTAPSIKSALKALETCSQRAANAETCRRRVLQTRESVIGES